MPALTAAYPLEDSLKKCSTCKLTLPRSQFNRRKRAKDGLQPCCRTCDRALHAAWYAANKERAAATNAAWHVANKERKAATSAAWYAANKERAAANDAAWAKANGEQVRANKAAWYTANRARSRANSDAWAAANPARKNAIGAKRRAAKLQATPPWADLNGIYAMYEYAKQLEAQTGVKHHVDHIIPLQGVKVRGLHILVNLQVIPALANLKKHNRFRPYRCDGVAGRDMWPTCQLRY